MHSDTTTAFSLNSHQSYPNITTVIQIYEYSPNIDNSTIKPYTNSILYNFFICHTRVLKGCKYKTTSWYFKQVILITIHPGLTASSMNVKCHTKNENRASLYCSSSSHQKSVSADDKSKHRTNLLTLALYMSHSSSSFGYRCIAVTAIHAVCVLEECFTIFPGEKRHN